MNPCYGRRTLDFLTFVTTTATLPLAFSNVFSSPEDLDAVASCLTSNSSDVEDLAYNACAESLRRLLRRESVLLTGSCTQALEVSALLLNLTPGDEVIVPSFTFPSTANAFALRGANILFADSLPDSPNIAPHEIARLLSPRTKAVVGVHYGGIACNILEILDLIKDSKISLVEDAAHTLGASYRGQPLGTFGSFGAFSFHHTKNISCNHGGALVFQTKDAERVEALSSKGTNQFAAKRKQVQFYEWVEIGSAMRMSGCHAAILSARLPYLIEITEHRVRLWERYYRNLAPLRDSELLAVPVVTPEAQHNAHIFFITTRTCEEAVRLLQHLTNNGIEALRHYVPLHMSKYGRRLHSGEPLPHAERFASRLIRLPLSHTLKEEDVDRVSDVIQSFFSKGDTICPTSR